MCAKLAFALPPYKNNTKSCELKYFICKKNRQKDIISTPEILKLVFKTDFSVHNIYSNMCRELCSRKTGVKFIYRLFQNKSDAKIYIILFLLIKDNESTW